MKKSLCIFLLVCWSTTLLRAGYHVQKAFDHQLHPNCVENFTYENQSLSGCYVGGGNNRGWCSKVANFSGSDEYEFCQPMCSSHFTNPQCHFPFVFDNVTYDRCIYDGGSMGDPMAWSTGCWCSSTPVYDGGPKLLCSSPQVCSSPSDTSGCHFPFEYNSSQYNQCIYDEHGGYCWCSPEPVYHVNVTKYRCGMQTCAPKSMADPLCVFPFIYGNRTYNECVSSEWHEDCWCSYNATYTGDAFYGYCNYTKTTTVAPKKIKANGKKASLHSALPHKYLNYQQEWHLENVTSISLLSCTMACHINKDCYAANYYESESVCQLFNNLFLQLQTPPIVTKGYRYFIRVLKEKQ